MGLRDKLGRSAANIVGSPDDLLDTMVAVYERPCLICGKRVIPRLHEFDHEAFYCSVSCAGVARARAQAKKDKDMVGAVLPRDMIQHTRRIIGGISQSAAEIRCAKCRKPGYIAMTARLPPDVIMRKFITQGWTHPARTKVLCPECAHPAPATPAPVKPKEEHMPIEIPKPTAAPPTPPAEPRVGVGSPVPAPNGASRAPAVTRELTPADKRHIRERLDATFDEERGYYLEDMSDDKIAAELDLPRAAVTKIREEGYGSIKGHPEVVELRRDFDKAFNELSSRLAVLESRFCGGTGTPRR